MYSAPNANSDYLAHNGKEFYFHPRDDKFAPAVNGKWNYLLIFNICQAIYYLILWNHGESSVEKNIYQTYLPLWILA